ncbi:hypothetical protein F5879DRAFT_926319 [Lentinula edodes]|uniref:uncharacterized protein n=1 Tax=Lentinula edodes TaxID=5353 RepID=UPI001E8E0A04|nr:uncharacterized protein C8R40DRAFT_1071967 [Lentinula edodes]KAH7872193.1 hypothetical protein C8R40DRAFT_1071967 [Lentinula edodes]KAJ3899335.1 hypothetical protein F5879DRAFT_926319 [Lentinula edodes]
MSASIKSHSTPQRVAFASASHFAQPHATPYHSPAFELISDPQPRIMTRTGLVQEAASADPCAGQGPKEVSGDGEQDLEVGTDDESALRKIQKPKGEVSRPGRGGYNLRVELKWSTERFDKVKAYIDKLVQEHLDCTEPLTKQIASKVEEVRSLAVKKFRFLDDYHDYWAVDDFVRCHLKYRKQALQKISLQNEAAKTRKEIKEVRQRLAQAEKEARKQK